MSSHIFYLQKLHEQILAICSVTVFFILPPPQQSPSITNCFIQKGNCAALSVPTIWLSSLKRGTNEFVPSYPSKDFVPSSPPPNQAQLLEVLPSQSIRRMSLGFMCECVCACATGWKLVEFFESANSWILYVCTLLM